MRDQESNRLLAAFLFDLFQGKRQPTFTANMNQQIIVIELEEDKG